VSGASERASGARPWTLAPGGLAVSVRLTPKGGRDAIDGIEQLADGRAVLKARVRSVASEGAANDALVRLIANTLDIAPRRVTLAAGATARIKRLTIEGDGAALAAALEKIVGGS
jgi:uncharacterized protein YggU (UPF0235/DUF167 family)